MSHLSLPTLRAKLATWFLQHCPTKRLNHSLLLTTGIPIEYFRDAYNAPFPHPWKFWAYRNEEDTRVSGEYHGASHDTAQESPFADIISLDQQAAMLGFLPSTFYKFVQRVSTNDDHTTSHIAHLISKSIRSHSYHILKKHRQLTNAQRDQNPFTPNSPNGSFNTQQQQPGSRSASPPPLDPHR